MAYNVLVDGTRVQIQILLPQCPEPPYNLYYERARNLEATLIDTDLTLIDVIEVRCSISKDLEELELPACKVRNSFLKDNNIKGIKCLGICLTIIIDEEYHLKWLKVCDAAMLFKLSSKCDKTTYYCADFAMINNSKISLCKFNDNYVHIGYLKASNCYFGSYPDNGVLPLKVNKWHLVDCLFEYLGPKIILLEEGTIEYSENVEICGTKCKFYGNIDLEVGFFDHDTPIGLKLTCVGNNAHINIGFKSRLVKNLILTVKGNGNTIITSQYIERLEGGDTNSIVSSYRETPEIYVGIPTLTSIKYHPYTYFHEIKCGKINFVNPSITQDFLLDSTNKTKYSWIDCHDTEEPIVVYDNLSWNIFTLV